MSDRRKNVLTVLARLAERVPDGTVLLQKAMIGRLDAVLLPAIEVTLETGHIVGAALAACLEHEGTIEHAKAVFSEMPAGISSLEPVARWAYEKYLRELHGFSIEDNAELAREYSDVLMSDAVEASMRGERSAYRASLVRALQIHNQLIFKDSDEADKDLLHPRSSATLVFLAVDELQNNEPEAALNRVEQALREIRMVTGSLSEDAPLDLHLTLLSTGYEVQAEALRRLRRKRSANVAIGKAIKLGRLLLQLVDPSNLEDLASVLSGLASNLIWRGRSKDLLEAMPLLTEATKIYRDLAEARPIQYVAAVAETLSKLAHTRVDYMYLIDVQDASSDELMRAAWSEFEEVVAMRESVRPRLHVDQDRLARDLRDLAILRAQLSSPGDAASAMLRAIKIRRDFAEFGDDVDLQNLVSDIVALGAIYIHVELQNDASLAFSEALSLCDGLKDPAAGKRFRKEIRTRIRSMSRSRKTA